jgi:hypothetical protein
VLLPLLARLLRLASLLACLIALASFVTFAVDQAGNGSSRQQAEVNGIESPGSESVTPARGAHESGLHKTLDQAFSTLVSPFSGITSGSHSQWTIQIVDTLLVLLVYGFALGFVARLLPGRL